MAVLSNINYLNNIIILKADSSTRTVMLKLYLK